MEFEGKNRIMREMEKRRVEMDANKMQMKRALGRGKKRKLQACCIKV
jgi:hypothetical protein